MSTPPGRREPPLPAADPAALGRDDDAIAPFRALAHGEPREAIAVEGEIPLRRLLAAGGRVRAVLCTPAKRAALGALLDEVPNVYVRAPATLRAIVGYAFHRGIVALAARPPQADAVPAARVAALRRAGGSRVVVAERVTDGANLGALVRNARAFGADLVIADAAGADVFSRKAVRASAGHVFELPIVVARDPHRAARDLVDALGGALAAAVAPAAPGPPPVAIGAWRPPAHVAIAFGNEADGLSPALLAAADVRITVPLAGGVDSLNVAASSAVLLHALGRAPGSASGGPAAR